MVTHALDRHMLAEDQTAILCCPACGRNDAELFLHAPDRFHGRRKDYELARCPSCSLVWLNHPPSPAEMGEHYGPDYDRSVAAAGDSPDRWKGRVEVISKLKSGGALLDLGCSSGGFLRSMKSPSWKLSGIEMSDEVARRAEAASGAEVFVGDILDAPFATESFDVVTCFHVFEHLYQPMAVLERVAKWLKPGGIFYLNGAEYRFRGSEDFWQLLVRSGTPAPSLSFFAQIPRNNGQLRRIGENVAYYRAGSLY